MPTNGKSLKIGWIGAGRMGIPMAERLVKAGYDVSIWNRTRAKAEPLQKIGGKVVDHLSDLKGVDVLFSIVATGKDVQEVLYGKNGVCSEGGKIPPTVVDCSTIAVEESAAVRERLKQLGADFIAAPVSGNAKVIKAGKLSAVVSGDEEACKAVMPLIEVFAPRGVSYVGEGELARVRFQMVTSWPALMSLSAMGMPMRPAPIQPIFGLCPVPFVAMPSSFLSGVSYHRMQRLVRDRNTARLCIS